MECCLSQELTAVVFWFFQSSCRLESCSHDHKQQFGLFLFQGSLTDHLQSWTGAGSCHLRQRRGAALLLVGGGLFLGSSSLELHTAAKQHWAVMRVPLCSCFPCSVLCLLSALLLSGRRDRSRQLTAAGSACCCTGQPEGSTWILSCSCQLGEWGLTALTSCCSWLFCAEPDLGNWVHKAWFVGFLPA